MSITLRPSIKTMKRIFTILPILLFFSTFAAAQAVTGGAVSKASLSDEDAVKSVLAQFIEAWNKHDAKAFSMVFAEDADFTNVRGTSAHGRAEVEKFHAPLFATRFKDTNQKMTRTKIRFLRADVAAVDAWWEMTGAKSSDGQDIPVRKGLLNFVMTKEKESWLIAVMHNMDLPTGQ